MWRRYRLITVAVVVIATMIVWAIAGYGDGQDLPLIAAVYAVGRYTTDHRYSLATAAAVIAVSLLDTIIDTQRRIEIAPAIVRGALPWYVGRPLMSATAMHERRAELQAPMSTAPADHCELIERLTAGNVGSAEVQEVLVAATTAQQERQGWIVANWPQVVELEQVNALINGQPALAHWSIATPPAVQAVLDAMVSSAPPPHLREQRSLAALDEEAPPTTPSDRPKPRSVTSTNSLRESRRTPNGRRSTRRCGQRGSSFDRLAGSNASTTSLPETAVLLTTPSSDVGSPWATTP